MIPVPVTRIANGNSQAFIVRHPTRDDDDSVNPTIIVTNREVSIYTVDKGNVTEQVKDFLQNRQPIKPANVQECIIADFDFLPAERQNRVLRHLLEIRKVKTQLLQPRLLNVVVRDERTSERHQRWEWQRKQREKEQEREQLRQVREKQERERERNFQERLGQLQNMQRELRERELELELEVLDERRERERARARQREQELERDRAQERIRGSSQERVPEQGQENQGQEWQW